MLEQLKKKIPPNKKLLLAISGGIDSMVMLHAVSRLKDELSLQLGIAHVDHALRVESAADASFVETKAKELGLDFHLKVLSSCLLYTSPSPRDKRQSRMPSSA